MKTTMKAGNIVYSRNNLEESLYIFLRNNYLKQIQILFEYLIIIEPLEITINEKINKYITHGKVETYVIKL